jgi:phospholipid/cholesterol/gamma-HCH transport system substrate-binding protein
MKLFTFSREMTLEILIGAFMVMAFLGLGVFTIALSRQTWFSRKYPMTIEFSHVMGLREGDNVVVRGMPLGKVDHLQLVCGTGAAVRVFVVLDAPLEIRRGYRASIVSTSILGGRHLEIEDGPLMAEVVPHDEVLTGQTPFDLMADAAEIVAAARRVLVDGKAFERLQHGLAQMDDILSRVNRGDGVLGKLLSSDATLYTDLAASVAALRKMSERLEKGEGTLGKLLSADDIVYRDLSASVASLRKIAEGLEKGQGVIGKLLSPDDPMQKDLAASVSSLRKIAEQIEKGEGTVGRLIQDDTLYEDARKAVVEIRGAVDDFRETEPIVSFSSLFLGAF